MSTSQINQHPTAASRKQALAQITETQNFFAEFASDQRRSTREVGDMSVELMSIPLRDEEQERLERLRAELDLERQRFTEATIRLGKEKAELAVSTNQYQVNSPIHASSRLHGFDSLRTNGHGKLRKCFQIFRALQTPLLVQNQIERISEARLRKNYHTKRPINHHTNPLVNLASWPGRLAVRELTASPVHL